MASGYFAFAFTPLVPRDAGLLGFQTLFGQTKMDFILRALALLFDPTFTEQKVCQSARR